MFSPWQSLIHRAESRPGDPLITWYGGAGARTELSAVTFANNVAKAVGFLRDDLMLEPGDSIAVRLGRHWQTPVWLHASSVVGLNVDLTGTIPGSDSTTMETVIAFDPDLLQRTVESGCVNPALVSDHPFGLPTRTPPAPIIDAARAVLSHPDTLPSDADDYAADFALTDRDGTVGADAIMALISGTSSQSPPPDNTIPAVCLEPTDRRGWLAMWAVPALTGRRVVILAADADADHACRAEGARVWPEGVDPQFE